MPQIDSIRLAARPIIELGSLTHSPTHRDWQLHTLPTAAPVRPPFHGTAERGGGEEEKRRESRYVGYFANSMSNRSHRIGPSLSLRWKGRVRGGGQWWPARPAPARLAVAIQCNGMCQRRIPLCLPSFALFAECRERDGRPTSCASRFTTVYRRRSS